MDLVVGAVAAPEAEQPRLGLGRVRILVGIAELQRVVVRLCRVGLGIGVERLAGARICGAEKRLRLVEDRIAGRRWRAVAAALRHGVLQWLLRDAQLAAFDRHGNEGFGLYLRAGKAHHVAAGEDAGSASGTLGADRHGHLVQDAAGCTFLADGAGQHLHRCGAGIAFGVSSQRIGRRRREVAVGAGEFLAVDRIVEGSHQRFGARPVVEIGWLGGKAGGRQGEKGGKQADTHDDPPIRAADHNIDYGVPAAAMSRAMRGKSAGFMPISARSAALMALSIDIARR